MRRFKAILRRLRTIMFSRLRRRNNNTRTAQTPGEQLAETAELVEAILLHLPISRVLLAQRVSRTWNDFIQGSPRLQKALFFQPCTDFMLSLINVPGKSVHSCYGRGKCGATNAHRMHKSGVENLTSKLQWAREDEEGIRYNLVRNPLLSTKFPWLFSTAADGEHKLRTAHKSFRHPQASWRRMLYAQPPIKDMVVTHDKQQYVHFIFPDSGVRLGDVQTSTIDFEGTVGPFFSDRVLNHVSLECGASISDDECTAGRALHTMSLRYEFVDMNAAGGRDSHLAACGIGCPDPRRCEVQALQTNE